MAKSTAPTETSEPCLTDHRLASSPPIISRLVADTSTTGHFLESSTSYTNKLVAHPGISVLIPNHGVMKSTQTVQLTLPFLLPEACKAQVFPCLVLGSLISIGQLCDYGCAATFTTTTVTVSLGGNQVSPEQGHMLRSTCGAWTLYKAVRFLSHLSVMTTEPFLAMLPIQ